jgi:titin
VLWFALFLLVAVVTSHSATFVVTNANDSGDGSLRSAMTNANANAGLDLIIFNMSGAGVHPIVLASALPTVSDPVVIDGTTQHGYAGQPLIELNGAGAGANSGLRIASLAGGTTIRGLVINRFGGSASGIEVDGASSNVFQGNFIGTDPTGTLSMPNGKEGIYLNGSSGNLIGGIFSSNRNVISGNGDAGVYVLGTSLAPANGNVIQGNYIGTTASGTARLGNGNNGVLINSTGAGASWNQIGGSTPRARNIISGNLGSGILLNGRGASNNLIQGNFIGASVDGDGTTSNAFDGITIKGPAHTLIGGTNAGEGNVISGNGGAGIALNGAGITNTLIQGNFIGVGVSGEVPLGNHYAGISLSAAGDNLIGGIVAAARNVISGNHQDGIFLSTNSTRNIISGNFIGVDAAGTAGLGNSYNGISIAGTSSNTIGGEVAGARNVISGNGLYGVELYPGAASNLIQGNYIGTESNGAGRVQNASAGIFVSGASGNMVGGAGVGNVISGNGDAGIYVVGPNATGNVIQGNKLGTDACGNTALANIYEGIYLESSSSNIIGGSFPGAGNLVSGNSTWGVFMTNCSWSVIQGNQIGTKVDGVSPLPNGFHNIECQSATANSIIGGAAGAGNTIAFANSPYSGVRIRPGSANNRISGNCIFSNNGLGISFSGTAPTLNDPCDADPGANSLQNFPVLSQAVSSVITGVRGTLNSIANTTYVLQFFANPACDKSGNGQGRIYLGDAIVATAGDCSASFVATLPMAVPVGYIITSTATDRAGNTSEFSACIPVSPVPKLSLTISGVSRQVNVTWPNTSPGFVLKQTASLAPPVQWAAVTNVPANVSDRFVINLPVGTGSRFYALSFE